MSQPLETYGSSSQLGRVTLTPAYGAGVVSFLSILGLTAIWGTVVLLWVLWTTDPLKSIGMVVPVISFLLVLRVWRSLGWEMDGSWWGLAILLVTVTLVTLRNHVVMMLVLAPQWTLYFPPFSAVMVAYGVGLAALFGGWRLVRAAWFPLALLMFVNPVPHVFNVYVDLPLQRASAHVARAFAIALGQPLSPDKLRLMFTPEFGMFIAPGCNGIRGAITMGLIALVVGYLYRFSWRALAGVVAGAVALGYAFNFVRLCVLVLYYLVALHFPALQDRAENADYLIGAGLFFVAVYLLYVVIQKLGGGAGQKVLELPQVQAEAASVPANFYARAGVLALLVCFGLVGVARAMRTPQLSAELAEEERAQGQFPQTVGTYSLVRTWNEDLTAGTLLYHFAEYAPAGGGGHISVGVSPVLGAHDTMVCHSARGEDPLWHAQETFETAGNMAVNFNAAFFNDGATQTLEATTMCSGGGCGEYSTTGTHLGFVYSRADPRTILSQNPARTIPILVMAETLDTTLPVEVARQQLKTEMAGFLSGLNVSGLTTAYRRE